MGCDQARELISASMDGESTSDEDMLLQSHLGQCASCRDYQATAAAVTRQLRLAPAPAIPDFVASLAAAGHLSAPTPPRALTLRVALLALALWQAYLSAPALFFAANPMGAPIHPAHQLGAVGMALAVGMAAVALRPDLAFGSLPILAVGTVALVAATVADVITGNAMIVMDLLPQTVLVAGLALVIALAWQVRQRPLGPLLRRRLPEVSAASPSATATSYAFAQPPLRQADGGAAEIRRAV